MFGNNMAIEDIAECVLMHSHPKKKVLAPSVIRLTGEPGVGKTRFAEYIADKYKMRKVFHQCTEKTDADELLFGINTPKLIDGISPRGLETGSASIFKGVLWEALLASWQGPTLVLIDEIDKSLVSTDAYLLSPLNSGVLYHPMFDGGVLVGNPANLYFIFTSNGDREFIEPLGRRWVSFDLPFPEEKKMFGILTDMLGPNKICDPNMKLIINFMYAYRDKCQKKKVVQNEIHRLITLMSNLGPNMNADIFKLMISPHKEDHMVMDTMILSPKYVVGKFIANGT